MLGDSAKVPIRRDADQEFVVDLLVGLELGVGLEIVVDGGLGVVARPPGAVGEHDGGHVHDGGVEDDAVAAGSDQWGVGFLLSLPPRRHPSPQGDAPNVHKSFHRDATSVLTRGYPA